MKNKIAHRIKFIICALLFVCSLTQAQDPHGLQVNQSAPDFSAKDQSGKVVTLKSLLKKGSVVRRISFENKFDECIGHCRYT